MSPADAPAPSRSPWFWAGIALALAPVEALVWFLAVWARRSEPLILGLLGFFALLAAGGGWGRPLRVRGRQLHPELREGSDWTAGERPRAEDLDRATRAA